MTSKKLFSVFFIGGKMLISIALLLIIGLFFGKLFEKLELPSLIGMIIAGILIGPYGLNLLDDSLLNISADLRELALIIILIRAGLSLSIEDLKKIGRPGLFMAFLPASLEIIGIVILAPIILDFTKVNSLVLATILAAASPAVIIPAMLNIIEKEYGTEKAIPQMILAGASLDDIYTLVLFTSSLTLAEFGNFNLISLFNIPVSIISGIVVGIALAYIVLFIFNFICGDTERTILILAFSLFTKKIELLLEPFIPMASLLSIIAMAFIISKSIKSSAMEDKFSDLWAIGQIFLFVLLAASVNIYSLKNIGLNGITLIILALLFRSVGVVLSLIKTDLNMKEKAFAVIAYTPKATVQAAIGGVPLAMGLDDGEMILSMSVLAILVTAPLGAIGIKMSYGELLEKN